MGVDIMVDKQDSKERKFLTNYASIVNAFDESPIIRLFYKIAIRLVDKQSGLIG
jgi:hypothetical protein